jgi:hypothetical protein
MATGYIRAAVEAFSSAESFGPCHVLHERWPNITPDPPAGVYLPLDFISRGSEAAVTSILASSALSPWAGAANLDETHHSPSSSSRFAATSRTTNNLHIST